MPLCTIVLVKLLLLPQQQVTEENKGRKTKRGGGVTFSYCVCYMEISMYFPQMSWDRDIDEELTPETWATMQKLSSSVRLIFIILIFVNKDIYNLHEIML